MELTPEQYDRIQQFADGDMTDKEQEAFFLEISNNPELQDGLDMELALREDLRTWQQTGSDASPKELNRFDDPVFIKSLIKQAGNEWQSERKEHPPAGNQTTGQMKPIHDRHEKKTGTPIVRFNSWAYIAVAAALVAAIVIIFQFSKDSATQITHRKKDSSRLKKDSTPQQQQTPGINPQVPEEQIDYASLFKEYYQKDAPPAKSPQLLADAFTGYDDGDYRELQRFDLYNLPASRGEPSTDQNSPQAIREVGHYYKGIAFIETRNEAKAMTNLNWVVNNAGNRELRGKAQYNLALLYLKKGNRDKAAELLEPVAANNKLNPTDAKARKLLQVLRKPGATEKK